MDVGNDKEFKMSQESTSSSALPEGQELLDGLYSVQSYLGAIEPRVSQFVSLEREFRSRDSVAQQQMLPHKEVIKARENKGQYGVFVVAIALAIFYILLGVLREDVVGELPMLLFPLMLVVGRVNNNKVLFGIGLVLTVASFLLTFDYLARFFSIAFSSGDAWDASLGTSVAIMVVVALVVAVVAAAVMLAAHNKAAVRRNAEIDAENARIDEQNRQMLVQLDEHNRQVAAQRVQLSNEIQAIKQQMLDATGAWFPPDYYCSAVVEQFISYVRNHQADTVKEMVTIYKEDSYRANVLSNQEQMKAQFNQALYNQQQMIQLQKVANALLMCNLIANIATATNSADIAASNREVAANTRATAANTAATANNTAATAASAASIASDADSIARRMGAKW